MALQKTKRASSTFAIQLPKKKLIPVRFSLFSVKKLTLAQSSLAKTLPSCRCVASKRDLFEIKITNRHHKNNKDNKAADDDFLPE